MQFTKTSKGCYENESFRIHKVVSTVYVQRAHKHHDSIDSKKVTDWTLVNLKTGNVTAGFGCKKHAVEAAKRIAAGLI